MRWGGVVVVAICMAAGVPAQAGLQQEMDGLFGQLGNVTPPAVVDTARRGGVFGGQVAVRNRIMNEQLVTFSPPSFRAGCGGIDLYAGSFSFINGEQFVQLARSVAANAQGYAFNLALGAACPQCLAIFETLQKKLQELNQHFANSCQLAKGIVNDAVSAVTSQKASEAGIVATIEGGVSDFFQGWTQADGKAPAQKAVEAAPQKAAERIQGNVVWRALKKANVGSWYTYGGDDLLMAILNVTGTVIVGPPSDAGDGSSKQDITIIDGGGITLADLAYGGTFSIQTCDGDRSENGCLTMSGKTEVRLRGFNEIVATALGSYSEGTGYLGAYRYNYRPRDEDVAVWAGLDGALSGLLVQATKRPSATIDDIVARAMPVLANELAFSVLSGNLRAARVALASVTGADAEQARQVLNAAENRLNAEYTQRSTQLGPFYAQIDKLRLISQYEAVPTLSLSNYGRQ
ncbi:MAG: hypothetical protein CMO30_15250 [Tistrella sp.]|nr:hypothetical protein [Tistrella sp.]MBA76625.1 hypothetical protein [Tistrella sp.]|tara:strand:+ start:5859 stop:7241 length:1383 start_codon:yes stop_codon:yes gene_type:complete